MNKEDRPQKKKGSLSWRTWLFVVLVASGIVGLWYWLGVMHFRTYESKELASQFGESFGYVNALLSALALAGVVIAIVIQMNELGLQRDELELTRNELSKSADAQTQLVHLGALTALLNAYLERYKIDQTVIDDEFNRSLMKSDDSIQLNLYYRILVCQARIESITNSSAGETLVSVVDTRILGFRRRLFAVQLRSLASSYSGNGQITIANFDTLITQGFVNILNYFSNFCRSIREMQTWANLLCSKDVEDALTMILNSATASYDLIKNNPTQNRQKITEAIEATNQLNAKCLALLGLEDNSGKGTVR